MCIQSDFAIDLHQNSPEIAAFERIKNLEEQLASALARIPAATDDDANIDKSLDSAILNDGTYTVPKARSASLQSGILHQSPDVAQEPHVCASNEINANTRRIADTVGFLSLSDSIGGEPAYVGSSSGISLATSLGQLVQSSKHFILINCMEQRF